jgi:hypothetical protein
LAQGTSIATELRAGLATFLTMAYIMFVNPAILEKAGMDVGAVFVATCLAAAAGSIIMGLYANYPIALCGNARRSPPHLHHDGLYRELGRRRGGRPDGPHRARRCGTVSAEPIPRPARPDRAALCYGARADLRRMLDGGESRPIKWEDPTEYIPGF